jgi:DNA-binding GntR family transcriptional regulator
VQVLWAKYPFDLVHRIPGRTARAAREHARIIDAVISRNEEAAAEAMRAHIRTGWDELQHAIAADPDSIRPARSQDARPAEPARARNRSMRS